MGLQEPLSPAEKCHSYLAEQTQNPEEKQPGFQSFSVPGRFWDFKKELSERPQSKVRGLEHS